MDKLPYAFLPPKVLNRLAGIFRGMAHMVAPLFPFLKLNLYQSDFEDDSYHYIAKALAATTFNIIMFFAISYFFLFSFKVNAPLPLAITITLFVAFFTFVQQLMYPRMLAGKKLRSIEQNLMAALQSMMIQLKSGVSLFTIMVNIGEENYGDVSKEFKKVVKQINAGISQTKALEDMASRNKSEFFRRTIWQIVNGMKAGSDIGVVLEDIISSLGDEQVLQIRNYGSQLNPLAMFYMLFAVIIPSLSVTFLTVLMSFMSISTLGAKMIFWGFFAFIAFFQFMFVGIIKSRRPNLI